MKIISVIKKSFLLQIRDDWALIITLLSAPFFVVIYWVITSGTSTTYSLLVINEDKPNTVSVYYDGKALVKSMAEMKYEGGSPILKIKHISNIEEGKVILQNRDADVMIRIPENFSKTLIDTGSIKPSVKLFGDIGNPRYSVAAIMVFTAVDAFVRNITKDENAVTFQEEFIGKSSQRTEYELAIPGIIVFSIVMLLFTAGMIFIRDIEDKTLSRLKITKMTIFDYVGGVTIMQLFVGALSVIFTFYTAVALGFTSNGSMMLSILVSVITFLSIIGITLIIVSFCKNSIIFLTAGNVPLFILMFLSGSMMPIPRSPLFTLGGRIVAWNDFLPPTHAVIALNKVTTQGENFSGILYELTFLTLLTILYFAIGIVLFRRKHLRMA
jgi:ABC-2 type transport system permease protein